MTAATDRAHLVCEAILKAVNNHAGRTISTTEPTDNDPVTKLLARAYAQGPQEAFAIIHDALDLAANSLVAAIGIENTRTQLGQTLTLIETEGILNDAADEVTP